MPAPSPSQRPLIDILWQEAQSEGMGAHEPAGKTGHEPARLAAEVEAILRRNTARREPEPVAAATWVEPHHQRESHTGYGDDDMTKFAAAISLLGDMAKRIFDEAARRPPVQPPVHELQNRLDRLEHRLDELSSLMVEQVRGLSEALQDFRSEMMGAAATPQRSRQAGEFSDLAEDLRALKARISGLSLDRQAGLR